MKSLSIARLLVVGFLALTALCFGYFAADAQSASNERRMCEQRGGVYHPTRTRHGLCLDPAAVRTIVPQDGGR